MTKAEDWVRELERQLALERAIVPATVVTYEAFLPGSRVTPQDGPPAVVLDTRVGPFGTVSYLLGWWNGAVWNEAVFPHWHVQGTDPVRQIGFSGPTRVDDP